MIQASAKQSRGQVRIYVEVGEDTTVCLSLLRRYGEVDVDDVALAPTEAARAEQARRC